MLMKHLASGVNSILLLFFTMIQEENIVVKDSKLPDMWHVFKLLPYEQLYRFFNLFMFLSIWSNNDSSAQRECIKNRLQQSS